MKKIKLLATSAFLLFCTSAFAQAPDIQWSKLYGGDRGEEARSIKQTPDGGFIVAASTFSTISGDVKDRIGNKEDDYWILKLDADGAIEWEKVYGGREGNSAKSIELTKDGGYIITGTSSSSDGDVSNPIGHWDYWVVKLNDTGRIEWEKSFGGLDQDESYEVKQTADEGYIVVGTYNTYGTKLGYNSNDFYAVKLDKNGNKEWDKFLGGSAHDVATSVLQTYDGGYLLGGWTGSNDHDVKSKQNGGGDWWVVKLTSKGAIEWETTYGGSELEILNGMVQTPDSNFVLTGWTRSTNIVRSVNNKMNDILIVKLSQDGKKFIWEKAFGGSSTDEATAIANTADNGLILTGLTYSNDETFVGNHGGHDGFLLKLDADGNMEWNKLFGGSKYDEVYAMTTTTDGGYAVAGFSDSRDGDAPTHEFADGRKAWVVRFDAPEMDSLIVKTVGDIPAEISALGSTLSLTATIYPMVLNQGVNWTIVQETGEATIDANGIVTAQAEGTVWGKAVSIANPLIADSIQITITDETNNISDVALGNDWFEIYPNPVNDIFYIKSNTAHSKLSLNVLNIEGRVLNQFKVAPNAMNGKAIQFNLNGLPAGVYLLNLKGEKIHSSKIFIKK